MRKTIKYLLAIVFVLAVLVIGFRSLLGDDDTSCGTALCCSECEFVAVIRVIDGDTFDSSRGRIRLFGVDTPERNEDCFSEATSRLRVLVGGKVGLERGPRSEDRFARQLFYVYTDTRESIDELLITEGLARAWTEDGQHRDLLVALEQVARNSGTGCLWRS